MQTLAQSLTDSKQPSTFAILRSTLMESGIRSLYTGLTASLLRQMSYSLVRLGSYEEMKKRLAERGSSFPGQLLLAAALAGGLGGVAGNPAGARRPIFCVAVEKLRSCPCKISSWSE